MADGADPTISFKFIQNPVEISTEDELYDLFDLYKDSPHKYFIMARDKSKTTNPIDFPVQLKMFRKFFWENSADIEDLATFVEVTNIDLADK